MSKGVTILSRGLFAALLGLPWASASAAATASQFTDEAKEEAGLAEAVLRRAEAAAQREFNPAFRKAALESLMALPTEELEKREASGSLGPLAIGASRSQLVYTPVTPCRIIDTRHGGGSLPPGQPRDFKVTGSGHQNQGGDWRGCDVPFGPTTAAVITFTAVRPTGPGYLRFWAYRYPFPPAPVASLLSYDSVSPNLNFSNTIVTAICDPTEPSEHGCPFDFRSQAEGNYTHVVADVVGYFERFPKEQARSFSVTAASPEPFAWSVSSSCASVPGALLFINAPVAGTVVVRGLVRSEIEHGQGTSDSLHLGVDRSADACSFPPLSGADVAPALPSDSYVSRSDALATFTVTPGNHVFYLSAEMKAGASAYDRITAWSLEGAFHPN